MILATKLKTILVTLRNNFVRLRLNNWKEVVGPERRPRRRSWVDSISSISPFFCLAVRQKFQFRLTERKQQLLNWNVYSVAIVPRGAIEIENGPSWRRYHCAKLINWQFHLAFSTSAVCMGTGIQFRVVDGISAFQQPPVI